MPYQPTVCSGGLVNADGLAGHESSMGGKSVVSGEGGGGADSGGGGGAAAAPSVTPSGKSVATTQRTKTAGIAEADSKDEEDSSIADGAKKYTKIPLMPRRAYSPSGGGDGAPGTAATSQKKEKTAKSQRTRGAASNADDRADSPVTPHDPDERLLYDAYKTAFQVGAPQGTDGNISFMGYEDSGIRDDSFFCSLGVFFLDGLFVSLFFLLFCHRSGELKSKIGKFIFLFLQNRSE